MKQYYSIGFDNAGCWNGICGVRGWDAAKAQAAEVAEEYGEMPEIRKVVPERRFEQEARTFHNPYL